MADKVIGFLLLGVGVVLVRAIFVGESPWQYFQEVTQGQRHHNTHVKVT